MDPAVASFVDATGADPAQAQEFLAAFGSVEAAVNAFFEDGGAKDDDDDMYESAAVQAAVRAAPGSTLSPHAERCARQPPLAAAPPAAKPAAKPKAAPRGGSGNVRSLADLAHSDDESDDEKPVETFIGGAKRCAKRPRSLAQRIAETAGGAAVRWCRTRRKAVDRCAPRSLRFRLWATGGLSGVPIAACVCQDKVASLFEKARQAGALDAESGAPTAGPPAQPTSKAFSGSGRTLSGAPSASAAPVAPSAPAAPAAVKHVITFYHNGFTVNGGPLRRIDDPANAPFMEAIASGHAPEELRPSDPSTPIHVDLVRKDEDWVAPPEPKYTAFAGSGRTLGGSGGGQGASAAVPVPSAGSWSVDESAPTTSLQLRLADGQRLVAKFNTTHTVAHIRAFIEKARPGTGGLGTLQTGMPPVTLDDPNATLVDAGLLGCVVTQKA